MRIVIVSILLPERAVWHSYAHMLAFQVLVFVFWVEALVSVWVVFADARR